MEDIVVSEVALDTEQGRITMFDVPDHAGVCLRVFQAIAAAGLVCPTDMAVASFDDFVWATAFQPRMTGIQQPTEDLARAAVELLFERIGGTAPQEPRRIVLPVRMVVRNSCGGPIQS